MTLVIVTHARLSTVVWTMDSGQRTYFGAPRGAEWMPRCFSPHLSPHLLIVLSSPECPITAPAYYWYYFSRGFLGKPCASRGKERASLAEGNCTTHASFHSNRVEQYDRIFFLPSNSSSKIAMADRVAPSVLLLTTLKSKHRAAAPMENKLES